MAAPVQANFRVHQQVGWPGSLARPNAPYAYDTGTLHVESAGYKPRPGDPVYYDATNDDYRAPAAANLDDVCGIIVYDQGTVQSVLASAPTNANSDHYIEYEDGDIIKVAYVGNFFALAGEALEYNDRLVWDVTERKWDVQDAPAASAVADRTGNINLTNINGLKDALVSSINDAIASLNQLPITCVSRAPVAADGIAELRIGFGRVQ